MSQSHNNLIRKSIAIGLVLILITMVTVSCSGVPREEYDELTTEVEAIIKQTGALEQEIEEGEAKIQSLESDIAVKTRQQKPKNIRKNWRRNFQS